MAASDFPQPDTQPFNSESFTMDSSDECEAVASSAWGLLKPSGSYNFPRVELIGNEYSFGKLASSDIIIDNNHTKDEEFLNCISKSHFRVFKENSSSDFEVVNLQDLSSNGTFVNKKKVGKGNKIVLKNKDDIGLAHANHTVYTFFQTSQDIQWIPREMQDVYSVIGALGCGAYGEVRLAKDKISGKDVAIKKIKKTEGQEDKVFNEVRILKELKHPFVVSMENVFETDEWLYIVLEYVRGGELAAKIREAGKLSNCETRALTYQLALALQYLHEKGVAHRDLKPENVLLSKGSNGESIVKVSDFGLSKLLSPEAQTRLKTVCGTPLYTAPEIFINHGIGSYTHQVDVWSLGVIIFYCLSGKLPFSRANSPMTVIEQIVRGSYSMRGPEWRTVAPQAASLVRNMLKVNPEERITIDQILNHPWLKDDTMKSKVNRIMKEICPVSDENLCHGYINPNIKRPRLAADQDNFLRP